jgi:ribosomal protein S18 acetylase RimI-like enzyme
VTARHIEIAAYRPEWREAFYRLNAQWLEHDFVIEDIDHRVLSDPEGSVLAPGGAIFFALIEGRPLGTCALLREAEGVYELSKMGVDEGHRGLGAGRLLLDAAIAEFRACGGSMLFLESNSKLKTALAMYRKAGFELQPQVRPGTHYARADVYMIYRGEAVDGG